MRHRCKWKAWLTTGSPVVRLLFALFLAGWGLSSTISSALPFYALTQPAQTESFGITGSIEGQVLFTGKTIPDPTVFENGADHQFCGMEQSFEDLLISKENRGIQNVILALANEDFPQRPPPGGEKLILDNRKCRFDPHVAVLTAGSTVEAINSDAIFHTTHLFSGSSSRNLSLHVGGKASHTLPRPGFVIVKCDIHDWMKAFIRVDNHPFHAVTDAGGRFAIRGIPEGSYTLEAWHERYGEQNLAVTVRAGKTANLEIEYPN